MNPTQLKNLKTLAFERGIIAPSILSADFAALGAELQSVERAGAKWIHVDVMDGHFVPNLTIGPVVVESLRKRTKSFIDCHLMVSRPQDWVSGFAKAGADCITVHAEATPHLHRLVHQIKDTGALAGVSLNPGTPLAAIEPVLHEVDLVLIMSVNPGFGGQSFIPSVLKKIERLVELRRGLDYVIQVDGGVNDKTATEIRAAGADVFVAGSAVFGMKDRRKAIRKIQDALDRAND